MIKRNSHLLDKGYKHGGADKTLFVKKAAQNVLIVQVYVYVDGSVFGSTSKELTNKYSYP